MSGAGRTTGLTPESGEREAGVPERPPVAQRRFALIAGFFVLVIAIKVVATSELPVGFRVFHAGISVAALLDLYMIATGRVRLVDRLAGMIRGGRR